MSQTVPERHELEFPPATVFFAWFALLAGWPLALNFRGYPAKVLAALWGYLGVLLDEGEILNITHLGGLRELSKNAPKYRLVLASNPVYLKAAWSLCSKGTAWGTFPSGFPTIFTRDGGWDSAEDPAATLVLRGDEFEADLVARYVRMAARNPECSACLRPPMSWKHDDSLVSRFEQKLSSDWERCVFEGLLSGSVQWLWSTGATPQETPRFAYRLVYELLHNPLVQAPDSGYNPLTVAMVGRANVYLQSRKSLSPPVSKFVRLDQDHTTTQSGRPQVSCQITRRELTDLGNTRGETVSSLLAWVRKQPNSGDLLGTIGFQKGNPPGEWSSREPSALARHLVSWTEKQVRTHFDRLRKDGLITGERKLDNGPWKYKLPETLTHPSAHFRGLPPPEEVEELHQEPPAGTATATPDSVSHSPAGCPDQRADATVRDEIVYGNNQPDCPQGD